MCQKQVMLEHQPSSSSDECKYISLRICTTYFEVNHSFTKQIHSRLHSCCLIWTGCHLVLLCVLMWMQHYTQILCPIYHNDWSFTSSSVIGMTYMVRRNKHIWLFDLYVIVADKFRITNQTVKLVSEIKPHTYDRRFHQYIRSAYGRRCRFKRKHTYQLL